jgi:hypothetical protein
MEKEEATRYQRTTPKWGFKMEDARWCKYLIHSTTCWEELWLPHAKMFLKRFSEAHFVSFSMRST